jgi:hypothetical protein
MQCFPASVVTEPVQLAVTWPRIALMQQICHCKWPAEVCSLALPQQQAC